MSYLNRFLDKLPIFEPINPSLTSYPILTHFPILSTATTCFNAFSIPANHLQAPERIPKHPHAFSRPPVHFFYPFSSIFEHFLISFNCSYPFPTSFKPHYVLYPSPIIFCNLLPIFETYFHLFLAISTIFKPLNSISKLFSSTTTYLYPIPIVFATYWPFLNLLPIFTYFHLQPSTLCHVWIRPPHVWCMSHMASTQTTSLWKHLNGRDISNEQSSTMTYIANQCGTSTRRSCVLKLSFARESNNGQ